MNADSETTGPGDLDTRGPREVESSQQLRSSLSPGIVISTSPRRRRWVAGAALVATLASLAIGIWLWHRRARPEPPPVDLTQVDPEVVEAITEARQEGLRKHFSGASWGHLGMGLWAHGY